MGLLGADDVIKFLWPRRTNAQSHFVLVIAAIFRNGFGGFLKFEEPERIN